MCVYRRVSSIIAWLSGWRLMLIARPCMLDAALPWSLGLRIFADWRVALCLIAMANGMSVHQSAEQFTISQSWTKFPQKAKARQTVDTNGICSGMASVV